MRILFVENRSATWLWAAVARELGRQGHEIHWLVQNRMFAPSFGNIHLLPIPRRRDIQSLNGVERYADILRTDRGILFYGISAGHYEHYDRLIGSLLDRVRPDVIFGESTQFHELLTIRHARRLKVAFLAPSVTRYPADRMCFYEYDTLNQVGGEGVDLSDSEADEMRVAIATRNVPLVYMEKALQKTWIARAWRAYSHAKVMIGWAMGERFITPAPWRRLLLDCDHELQRRRWEGFAAGALPGHLAGKPWVLYPLQMQPEANIDVFGQPWNDQAQLVQRAARALVGMGGTLVIKPNPKSRYELSGKLCDVVNAEANVVALSHDVSMDAVFPPAPLVLTVTGTVLLECVCAGKPVACLGQHAMGRYRGVTVLENPEQLGAFVQGVLDGENTGATRIEARSLLKFLHRTSYPALIWDPIVQPYLMNQEQIAALAVAFADVLSKRNAAALSWAT